MLGFNKINNLDPIFRKVKGVNLKVIFQIIFINVINSSVKTT